MSCNGCRVLRKGCRDSCALRSCLQWIESPESQAHATLFLAKFFGRSGLLSFISSVPETKRPALFQSLLYEGCGRTINPVNGAVGLLLSGSWHTCQAAVDTVLAGGVLRPLPETFAGIVMPALDHTTGSKDTSYSQLSPLAFMHGVGEIMMMNHNNSSLDSDRYAYTTNTSALKRESAMSLISSSGESEIPSYGDNKKRQVLNLFM